jgi:NMD protein affecting ribosome stability and mRNA decay
MAYRRGRMDYEEEYEELELLEVCEDCDRLQQQVYERTMRLRETEFNSELQQKRAKSLLDAAVQEQLRHQREHGLEEELPEDC